MHYIRVLVLLTSLLLLTKSAFANVLTPADDQSYHDLDIKMLAIADGLYTLISDQPATAAPDCLTELAFKFDAVQSDLHTIGTLVGLAANMADKTDELRVMHYLSDLGFSRAIEISSTYT